MRVKEKEKELNYGRMEVNMSDIGNTIKQMVRGDSFTLMAMSMRVNGTMTKLKEKEHMSI